MIDNQYFGKKTVRHFGPAIWRSLPAWVENKQKIQ